MLLCSSSLFISGSVVTPASHRGARLQNAFWPTFQAQRQTCEIRKNTEPVQVISDKLIFHRPHLHHQRLLLPGQVRSHLDSQPLQIESMRCSSRWRLLIRADGIHSSFDYSVVAVHGLNGHRENTWTVDGINWLRDFLPLEIQNARILSWGYDANTHSRSQISFEYLYNHAKNLVADLCLERRLTKV